MNQPKECFYHNCKEENFLTCLFTFADLEHYYCPRHMWVGERIIANLQRVKNETINNRGNSTEE